MTFLLTFLGSFTDIGGGPLRIGNKLRRQGWRELMTVISLVCSKCLTAFKEKRSLQVIQHKLNSTHTHMDKTNFINEKN